MHPTTPRVLNEADAPHPLAVYHAVTDAFGVGKEWLLWSPEMLGHGLERVGLQVPESTLRIVRAVQTVATREDFWENPHHFHLLAQALNGLPFTLQEIGPLQLRYLYVAVDGALEVRHALGVSVPVFSDAVTAYVAACALDDHLWLLLDVLEFAQEVAAKRRWRCADCGAEGEVWAGMDGLCDICTDRFRAHHQGSHDITLLEPAPNPEMVAAGIGTHVTYRYVNDPRPVLDRLLHLAKHPTASLPEGRDSVCAIGALEELIHLQDKREQAAVVVAAHAPHPSTPTGKEAGFWGTVGHSAASSAGALGRDAAQGAKGWWASESPTLYNMALRPHTAVAEGLQSIAAPLSGETWKGKAFDATMRGVGVAGTAYGAYSDGKEVDDIDGRRRGLAERALGTVGGLYASVAGWPLGMIAGTATGIAGSMGGAAIGRAIDRRLGGGTPAPPPMPTAQPVPWPAPTQAPTTPQQQPYAAPRGEQ